MNNMSNMKRAQIDSTLLDVYVLDDETNEPIGRPYFSLIKNMETGYLHGFYIGFEPPSYTTAMHALKRYIQTK